MVIGEMQIFSAIESAICSVECGNHHALETRYVTKRMNATGDHRICHLESKIMYRSGISSEIDQVISTVVRSISLETLELTDEFFPAHLSIALVDAVFRTRYQHGELSIPAAEHYCRQFGLARTRGDKWNLPPANEQETLGDLIRRYDELGLDAMSDDVFGIRRCFPEQRPTAAMIVLRGAKALRSIGVGALQDVSARHAGEINDALQCLPGVGYQTIRRLLMYTGDDDFVLGDVHVRSFVSSAVGREAISSGEAESLVRSAAHELILSPRFLDREIWLYGLSN